MKPLRKGVSQCSDKNQPKFCGKTCGEEQPFIFTINLLNHIFQTSVLFNTCNRMYKRNWLWKHLKKGQKKPSSHSFTQLSKIQFFSVSIVKGIFAVVIPLVVISLVATTRFGFWTWIWSIIHCWLGREVTCWFQYYKNSLGFIWMI